MNVDQVFQLLDLTDAEWHRLEEVIANFECAVAR